MFNFFFKNFTHHMTNIAGRCITIILSSSMLAQNNSYFVIFEIDTFKKIIQTIFCNPKGMFSFEKKKCIATGYPLKNKNKSKYCKITNLSKLKDFYEKTSIYA